VPCIDVTRDIKGTFYILSDFNLKHDQLKCQLEEFFKIKLKNSSNVYNSCLQFEEKISDSRLFRRFKVYNKILQMLQSTSARMALGINLNKIINPKSKFYNTMIETIHDGITRLEISYYANTKEAENKFFTSEF
jgi:hypothetical protein